MTDPYDSHSRLLGLSIAELSEQLTELGWAFEGLKQRGGGLTFYAANTDRSRLRLRSETLCNAKSPLQLLRRVEAMNGPSQESVVAVVRGTVNTETGRAKTR